MNCQRMSGVTPLAPWLDEEAHEPATMARQEVKCAPLINKKSTGSIDPATRSWIDNVFVPALLERWFSSEDSKAA